MTTVQLIPCPEEYAEFVKGGGYWYKFSDTNANALVFWRGGPHSPDHDTVLHWIEAIPRGHGFGGEMLRDVCVWADHPSRRVSISLLCESELADWFSRFGFLRMEARYGQVVMGRAPSTLGSKLYHPSLS